MTAQTIPPATLLDDLHPARFLRAEDLINRWKVTEITVTIHHLNSETTIPNPRDIDPTTKKPREIVQPVLYFQAKTGEIFPRGYLLSTKVDIESMKAATRAVTVGDLAGKRIKIKLSTHKDNQVLRIDPTPVI